MGKLKTKERRLIYAVTFMLLAVLSIFVLAYSHGSSSVKLFHGEGLDLNQGWYYYTNTGQKNYIDSLPVKIPAVNSIATIYHLIDTPQNLSYLSFYTHHQNVRVTHNGEPVYTYQQTHKPSWLASYRSFHHIIQIPPFGTGELAIETEGLMGRYGGEFSRVYIGDQFGIMNNIFRTRLLKIIMGAVLIVLGIFITVITILFTPPAKREFAEFYFSLLMIVIGIWQIEESRILQFFIGSQSLHWILEYVLQLAILMLSYLFFSDINPAKGSISEVVIFWTDLAVVLILTLLQVTGVVQLSDSVTVLHIMFIITLCYAVYILLAVLKTIRKSIKIIIISAISVSIALFILLMLNVFPGRYLDAIMGIGFVVMFTAFTILIYQRIIKRFEARMQEEFSKKLAMLDFSTDVSSRNAWYAFVEQYKVPKKDAQGYCLFMLVMSNLKSLNETYGYVTGDKVLKEFSACIRKIFMGTGEIFRVGGNKFICLCPGIDDSSARYMLDEFREITEDQKESSLKFTATSGYALFTPRFQKDFFDAQDAAEMNMHTIRHM